MCVCVCVCVCSLCVQELKAKQKELETKAKRGGSALREDSLFKTNVLPLHRKPSCARPKKQQAVVSPLQGEFKKKKVCVFHI